MSKPYNPRDAYYRKAKEQHLRARSAFKIDEIQSRWRIVRSGNTVIDLGAAPGGFLQVLAETVGPQGKIVGVDLDAIRPLGGVVTTLQSDVMTDDLVRALTDVLGGRKADVVASDLAPKTSGIREADEARSLRLVRRAVELAGTFLKPGGHLIAKVFMGAGFDELLADLRRDFQEVRVVRPEATRARSREVYVVGLRARFIGRSTDAFA